MSRVCVVRFNPDSARSPAFVFPCSALSLNLLIWFDLFKNHCNFSCENFVAHQDNITCKMNLSVLNKILL